MTARLGLVALLLWACSGVLHAHALQPGFLDIRSLGGDVYSVGWKVPQVKGRPMPIVALLPETCEPRRPSGFTMVDGAFSTRWTSSCPGGLAGRAIRVEGLERTQTDVLVHFAPQEGTAQTLRLTPDATAGQIARDPGFWEVVRTYTWLGIDHILLGIDHILFVFALLLLVSGPWRLVKTITAFTVAHSLTLSAAALGFVTMPGPPVEAAIALSIVYLARELGVRRPGVESFAERKPWLVAFVFGLLHGLGFASALAETGLPEDEIPAALLAFNVGVEIGQLLFIAVVLAAIALLRRVRWRALHAEGLRAVIASGGVYAIGGVASFWVIERVNGFW